MKNITIRNMALKDYERVVQLWNSCRYKFKELYITSHSMGGLVVRSFLVNFGNLFPFVTHFISISTPWGGEQLAEMGVKYSPAVPVREPPLRENSTGGKSLVETG